MRPPSQKTLHKNRAGGLVQGEGPELKPQYRKKKKKKSLFCIFTDRLYQVKEFPYLKQSSVFLPLVY
jgi:hypothetical protein